MEDFKISKNFCKDRNDKAVILSELGQRERRERAVDRRRGKHAGRGRGGALPHGFAAAMRRPGLAILESLSALAVEGRQEALLADTAMHIRDNRIPGTCCTRAPEVLRGRHYRYTLYICFMLQNARKTSEIDSVLRTLE